MEKDYIYLYGMILMTTSHLLKDDYPKADSYGEIKKTYHLPGGETGTGATVLSSLGAKVKLDGNHLGRNTYPKLEKFYSNIDVDITEITFDNQYEGLEDMVLIDKNTRTCFGHFQEYFSDKQNKRWNIPQKEVIQNASVVGLDPFFFDESLLVARYCNELNKKYVTIDCKYDNEMHKYSAVNVISNEFIKSNYPDENIEDLFGKYTNNTNGLVIFTFGSKDVLYGRSGENIKRFTPYKVDVISTLGAGDCFKAGAVYAVYKGMSDTEIVSFASATAGVACSNFPINLNPPTLEKIKLLQTSISTNSDTNYSV
jgi:sugar/nucleoside kinase (ribokinase family)